MLKKVNKDIVGFLKSKQFIKNIDNIFYAEKAFMVNSILRYTLKAYSSGSITNEQVDLYFKCVSEYQKGNIDFVWTENGLILKNLKGTKNNDFEKIFYKKQT